MNYPWRISAQFEKSPWKLLSIQAELNRQKLPILAQISNLFHHLCSCEQGIEVCLADRPALHQKLGFAIKRNAHLCLSLQVTRTDEGPCKSPIGPAMACGLRQGVVEISSEIYRLSHRGSTDKIRQGTTEVNRVHNSYPVVQLRMGRQWRGEEDVEVDETQGKTLHSIEHSLATNTSVWPTQLCLGSSYAYSGQLIASRKEHKCGICPQKCCLSCMGKWECLEGKEKKINIVFFPLFFAIGRECW